MLCIVQRQNVRKNLTDNARCKDAEQRLTENCEFPHILNTYFSLGSGALGYLVGACIAQIIV